MKVLNAVFASLTAGVGGVMIALIAALIVREVSPASVAWALAILFSIVAVVNLTVWIVLVYNYKERLP